MIAQAKTEKSAVKIFSVPDFVKKILLTFEKNGYEIYIVGGAVRDLLLKRPVNDWDFTTNATPEIILSLFQNSFYDNQYGTVGIVNSKEKKATGYYGKPPIYEITTFRKELGYSDQRHPDQISWGKTLQDDLVRREFTISALALKPIGETRYELIDYHGGQQDLEDKIIRAVGDADTRFSEDALRMMRAVRIATQLGFNIEPQTFQAIKSNARLINYVSQERIRDELFKIMASPFPDEGYLMLRNSGLAAEILPEAEKMFGVEQKSPGRHHVDDVGTHSIKSLKESKSKNPVVNLAILLHDLGKPPTANRDQKGTITFYNHEVVGAAIAKRIAKRLNLSRKDSNRLYLLVRWHLFTVDERQTDKAIRRFIRNVGKENLGDILELRRADRLGGGALETSWRLERFKQKLIEVQKQPFTVADLKINGHDVMELLQVSPGPMVGKVLNQLFTEVENDKLKNQKDALRDRVKKIRHGK